MNELVNYAVQCAIEQAVFNAQARRKERAVEIQR